MTRKPWSNGFRSATRRHRSSAGTGALLVAVLGFGELVAAGQRRPQLFPFERLTVPADKLPAGCHLKPWDPGPRLVDVETNPAITRDALAMGFIRSFFERPPGRQAGAPGIRAQAEGVEAAYVAIYAEPGAPEIGVYGLRFLAPIAEPRRGRMLSRGAGSVVAFDDVAVRVWVDGTSRRCYTTVLSHVRMVAKPQASPR